KRPSAAQAAPNYVELYCNGDSKQKPPPKGARADFGRFLYFESQLFAGAVAALSFLAYLRRKRSTRPAVSINFCLPVKNGWHAEQISTLMSPRWAERVTKALPQAQWTRTSL